MVSFPKTIRQKVLFVCYRFSKPYNKLFFPGRHIYPFYTFVIKSISFILSTITKLQISLQITNISNIRKQFKRVHEVSNADANTRSQPFTHTYTYSFGLERCLMKQQCAVTSCTQQTKIEQHEAQFQKAEDIEKYDLIQLNHLLQSLNQKYSPMAFIFSLLQCRNKPTSMA
ncbi:hypothetical protein LXL04_023404 [Taraxacum kok-saghyz]